MSFDAKIFEHWGLLGQKNKAFLLKRIFDLAICIPAFLLLLPLFVLIALLVLCIDGRPVLFRHERVGIGGRSFQCIKFRSMVSDAEGILINHLSNDPLASEEWSAHQKLSDDPRVTRLGRSLRRSSLDELPQLLNVIVGDMSLVGPRPIVVAEMDRYGDAISAYLSMRPGLTGLWQVSGRSACSYRERVFIDREYVASWTLARDFQILLKTMAVVFAREGSL
jgi:exopolysaccharide production protein ExoY